MEREGSGRNLCGIPTQKKKNSQYKGVTTKVNYNDKCYKYLRNNVLQLLTQKDNMNQSKTQSPKNIFLATYFE